MSTSTFLFVSRLASVIAALSMKRAVPVPRDALAFHHPAAFWLGCAAVAIGVGLHLPTYVMAAPMHFRLAGMPMDVEMQAGMGLILCGVLLTAYGLLPRLAQVRKTTRAAGDPRICVSDDAPLNREHWKLLAVLAVVLMIDVMKPATVAFVMPGMAEEYHIDMSEAGYLALSALAGASVGSLAWGRLADVFGRRSAILLSALMFMGTAICGTMPSFTWNVVMCFIMGAAAGGMLPIAVTLMAETVPARHRGWLLVAVGGIGTTAGFFAASIAATLLEPMFSWRVLWLLNLPTGAVVILLNRYIPESPRFLSNAGMTDKARAVLARFTSASGGSSVGLIASETVPVIDTGSSRTALHTMLDRRHARITLALITCGLAWGLVNFGFVLWLPANLQALGLGARATSALLARSALLSLPGIALAVWLYQHWSSFKSLVLFVVLIVLALFVFAAIEAWAIRAQVAIMAATILLLMAISGTIATMIPYAAEIYPVRFRGTGAGIIAAGSKAGGILGALLGVAGLFDSFVLSAVAIALPMLAAGIMLRRFGVETSRLSLEAIHLAISRSCADTVSKPEH